MSLWTELKRRNGQALAEIIPTRDVIVRLPLAARRNHALAAEGLVKTMILISEFKPGRIPADPVAQGPDKPGFQVAMIDANIVK